MKSSNFDYNFTQKLLKLGQHFLILPFQLKVPYLQRMLILILATLLLCLAYYSTMVYWTLGSFIQNKFMYIIWYMLQLVLFCIIILKHITDNFKLKEVQILMNRIEYFSKENGFTMKSQKRTIIFEIILSYSLIILYLIEWLAGYDNFYFLIIFAQWKITTFYLCFLFLIIRNFTSFIRRRYDFFNDYLVKMDSNVLQENVVMYQLNQIGNVLVNLDQLLRTLNDFFGLELMVVKNMFVVYFVNSVIILFKKWGHVDGERNIFDICSYTLHSVSIHFSRPRDFFMIIIIIFSKTMTILASQCSHRTTCDA